VIFYAALAAHIVLAFAAVGAAVREAGGGTARPELALSANSCA